MKICGRTLIDHVIIRALAIDNLDHVIVALPSEPEDDVLADEVEVSFGSMVSVFRGEPLDVQKRFLDALANYEEAVVTRITADDPFRSPELFRAATDFLESGGYDLVRLKPGSAPLGIDAEVFRLSALRDSRVRFPSAKAKEHVTFALIEEEFYKSFEFEAAAGTLGNARLTVDTREDFVHCESVAQLLSSGGHDFSLSNTLDALQKKLQAAAR